MNNIKDVSASDTHRVFTLLKSENFEAELRCHFNYMYDRYKKYLAIHVSNAELQLNKLFDLCNAHSCEIIVVKYAGDNNVKLEVRKPAAHAEFISAETWSEFSCPGR